MIPYRVLAVGSSREGLPEVEALLGALPAELPLPVALCCERDPEERDALLRRLQAATRLSVLEPDDKDDLEPGRVYLAPAGYHLILDRGTAALACDPEPKPPSPAALFDSAADSYGKAAAAVLFAESETDASTETALERVRACGGLALRAQGPDSIAHLLIELRRQPGKDSRGRE